MATHHYDQVYSYEKILKEVKALILPTIVDMINPKDIETTGMKKEDIAAVVYSQIMALGYSESDLNAALNNLMPTRNLHLYPGPAEEEAVNMFMHLAMILEDYKHQVWAFQNFHKDTMALKPHKEVITNVSQQLFAIQFGL